MKIDNLKINGFGKLKDKDINLSNGINVIYGENESGKSSLLKFISSMLYGVSRNKNGKDISDFEKFKPWKTEEFSGKIKYTLDDNNSFEVYREFKKKSPVIYNSQKEDISKNFKIDKNKEINFFSEQTGIEEETFYSTAITEQEGVKLTQTSQNNIIQKISNLISTGDDNVSFKKSLDKISKKQNEEVGTERTSQRPLNIVENKIYRLLQDKKNLEIYKENMYDKSLEKQQLELNQKDEEIKKEFLKEIKNKLDNNRLKSAEINFNKNLENDYTKKIEELNSRILSNKHDSKKTNNKKYYILIAILLLIFMILIILSPYKIPCFILFVPIIYILYKMFKEKKIIQNKNIADGKIANEIEILKQNKEEQKGIAEEKEQKFSEEIQKEKKNLIDKYLNILDLGFMEENLDKSYDEVLREIEVKENIITNTKLKLHTIENENKQINNKLEDLAKLEEEIEDAESEKEELLLLNNSYNIAKECLEKAYKQVKENISPTFTQNLCDIISKISNGKYNNIVFSDTDGLMVEIDNGNYMPVSRLSVGTIDQMYISLRLSALNEITKETMPIIFDEAFAYFDDERLENILKYLNINFSENQIIIFTCSNREKEILDKLNIKYNITNI